MINIRLSSIDERMCPIADTIILFTQSIENDPLPEYYKGGREDDPFRTWFKLRNREDAFVTRWSQRHKKLDVRLATDALSQLDGKFTVASEIVFSGEILYQNVQNAVRFKALAGRESWIEFDERTWDTVSQRLLAKCLSSHSNQWILDRIVYLTANAKTPKRITCPVPALPTDNDSAVGIDQENNIEI